MKHGQFKLTDMLFRVILRPSVQTVTRANERYYFHRTFTWASRL